MTDYSDFDLERSMAQAWDLFEERLADVVASMDDSSDLTIDATEGEGADMGAPWVRFSCLRSETVRAEAASNSVLGESDLLGIPQLELMEASGWLPPGEGNPPSHVFHAERSQEQADELAHLAVVALRDVYGVQHPAFLAPDQLAEILTLREVDVNPPALAGMSPEDVIATVPLSREHLDAMITRELADLFGHAPLKDSDGDHAIRVGSTMVFVRATSDLKEVVVFAVVVHDVEGRSRATELLNDINAESRFVRFELIRDRVFVQQSVLAQPFVPAHLHQAVTSVSEVADGVDEALARRLNGRTTFPD